MTRDESMMIVDRIQTHRQYFLVTKKLCQEWAEILMPYDYADVDRELTKFLQNGDNFGKTPEVYQLVKHLTKSSEKILNQGFRVFCIICNKKMSLEDYDNHYDRCSSVEYVIENFKKYFDKSFDRDELMDLNDDEFDLMYWKLNKQLLEKVEDGRFKNSLMKTLRIHEEWEAQNDRVS